MTRRVLTWTMAAACICTPAVAAVTPASVRTTAKSAQPFAQCFAQAQDRASRPWSFVPRQDGGGTFSNAGPQGAAAAYYLKIADRGALREIRLTSTADGTVVRAVDECI